MMRAPTHTWGIAAAIADELGVSVDAPGRALARVAADALREIASGASPSRSIARACDRTLDLVPDRAATLSGCLPSSALASGAGNELACALVAREVANVIGVDAHVVLTPRLAAVAIDDAVDQRWSIIAPSLGAVTWTTMPAEAVPAAEAWLPCPHELGRTLLAQLADAVDARQLPIALALLDELTPAANHR